MSGRVTPKRTIPVLAKHFDPVVEMWEWFYDATDIAVDAWINRPRIGDTRPAPSTVVEFKPRDHFRADGLPKRWLSEAGARAEALERGMRCYQCSVCQGWHLGHHVRTKRKVSLGTPTAVAC
jgi:hypothetical protein